MRCLNPIMIKTPPPLQQVIEVPCCKCMECRVRRTAEWTRRILDECAINPESNCFLTLTYDDDHLPLVYNDKTHVVVPTLDPKDLQDFFKRFRKRFAPNTIKYYACGEYGDDTNRPHYHIALMGWRPSLDRMTKHGRYWSSQDISDVWTMGHNTVGTLNKESAQYVAGYIRKKLYGKADQYAPAIPPFSRQSRGIGLRYAQQNWRNILSGDGYTVNGKSLGIPRYYIRKIATQSDIEALRDIALDKEADKIKDYYTYYEYQRALNSDRVRRELDLIGAERSYNMRVRL